MFNWVLCVCCVCVSLFLRLPQGGIFECMCVCVLLPNGVRLVCMCESRSMFHVSVCRYLKRPPQPLHLGASSFPSSWHLSLGRVGCGVSLIKASTVWLMNRLCGISAPGWRSHSAALRLLWGPPFLWALNQETALITLPLPSSSFSFIFLPHSYFLSSSLSFSLCSTTLFLCPSYLAASPFYLSLSYHASSLG